MRAEIVMPQEGAAERRVRQSAWLRGVVTAAGSGSDGMVVELWAFVDHAPHFVSTTIADAEGRFSFEAPSELSGADPGLGYELRVLTSDGRLLHSEHHVLPEELGTHRVNVNVGAVLPDFSEEATPAGTGDEATAEEALEQGVPVDDVENLTPVQRALAAAGLPTAPEELIDVSSEELGRALRDAVEQGVLAREFLPELDARVEELCRAAVDVALETGPFEQAQSRGGVIASLDLSAEQRREVLSAYQGRSYADSSAELWGEAETGVDEAVLSQVATCLELTEVVGHEPPLIRRLHQAHRRGLWNTVEDLTELEFEDWCELVEDCYHEARAVTAEEGDEADAAYQRFVEARAGEILDRLEEAHPSPYVRRALLNGEAVGSGAQELLNRAETHDLSSASIRARVAEDASLVAGMAEEEAEAAIAELEGVERLIHVTHHAEEVATLAGDGLDSAHAIASLGRASFIEAYAEQMGGRAQAARVHAQAQTIAAANQMAALGATQARGPVPFVLGGAVPDTLTSVPQFRHLFAGNALCDCEHCGSVYSPAAYFVDLLRYLGDAERLAGAVKRIGVATKNASRRLEYKPLDLLLARRPDLADIPLTCENTLTPLPYIDLVNEILEARVTGTAWNPDTGKTPADVLRAIPQSTNRAAYDVLQSAVFPLSLPYHEALDAFRAHVAHLGVSRLALLTTFARGRPIAEDIVAESLGTSREELSLIVEPLSELWRHWGGVAALSEPELVARLTPAPVLMKAAGLSFADLVALCSMRFLTQLGRVALVTPAVDCDPAQVRVEGLGAGLLERMLKLMRLRRRLSWSYAELDRVLTAFAATALDLDTLKNLVAVRELSERLSLTPSELLVLWAPLDTYGRENAFTRLLQTRVVAWQVGSEQFRLRPDQSELLSTGEDLSVVAPALLAAFRITNEELAVAIRLNVRRGQQPSLDLAGLSAIYRVAVLARALGLAPRQLEGLVRLAPADADPFVPKEPTATLRFVDLVKEVQGSPFSPEQLVYLFLHEAEPRFDPTPKPAQVETVLSSVRRALVDAYVETMQPSEIGPDTLRQKLALLLDATLLDAAIEVLDPRTRLTEAQRREFFARHLARVFADPEAVAARLFTGEGASSAVPEAATAPIPASGAGTVQRAEERAKANAALVLTHLLPFLRAKQLRGAIVQVVGDSLGLSAPSTARLLERVLRSRRQSQSPLIVDFAALLGTGLSGAYFDNADLEGEPKGSRLEPEINFSWAGSAPAEGVPGTGFSARYTGRVHPKAKGEHTFYVSSEGAVRFSLVIDGEERVLIDRGAGASAVESSSAPVRLDSGRLYELRLEYRNRGGSASLALSFGTSPSSKQLIPTTFLYPSDGLSSFAPVEESYRRLHKAALLLGTFGATDAHLDWLSGETRPIDLDALPMSAGDEALAKAQFARFRKLAALYAFRKQLPPSETDVFEVFREANPAEASKRLLQATGWDAAVVEEMIGPQGLAASAEPAAPPTEQPLLLRLARAMDVQRRVGVSAGTLFSWASAAPDARMAREAAQAVKARYDEKRWLEVAKGLNDPLRLARRDALVAYLLPRLEDKGVTNRNQLFEYFLIDVDMNPCMLTSRIRQAIGSVQTYYQRCLMSLELTHPRLIDERAWQWMKNYRVWEANRKILLYPENWIEPELRDDKSPLFTAFERAILQDEIKRENVEAALIDYVQGLDEIARLDVRATCFEPDVARARDGRRIGDTNGGGTYHVFARTFGAPQAWYHRRLQAGLWTAWEKIEADIDGEHLLPVLFHDRLHLFWATFREVSKKPPKQNREDKGPILELGKDWEIKLAYAVYDRGRWSRKRASNAGLLDRVDVPQFIVHGRFRIPIGVPGSTTFAASDYRLTARAKGAELRVQVWRRRIVDERLWLDPLTVTALGEFILDGCNGELRGSAAEHLTTTGSLGGRGTRVWRLAAPSGSRVDGQGFALGRGRSGVALTLPSDDVAGHAPLLTRVDAPHARVLLAEARPGRPAPLFFQTAQQCFFAYPVGGSVARRVLQFSRFPQFGIPRVRAKAKQKARAGRGRRGREEESWFDEASEPEASVDAELLSPSERDAWEDEQDEAWQPENAEARRSPRARRAPSARPARRPARPAAKRPPPARPAVTSRTVLDQRMRFVTFQHTKSCDLLIALKSGGLDGLFEFGLRPRAGSSFGRHGATALVDAATPKDDLDFDLSSPYGLYNWELFFHAPLLVALRLAKEGRHEEAQRFFHFIFDPTVDDSDPSPKRFWRFLPLKLEHGESARQIVATLSRPKADDSPEARSIHAQLMAWFEKPFSPHVIARLRFVAYQKTVVMKYIDNLLAWGDRLFRQDTMESIQEATQLYILASNIMGPRPERIDRIVENPPAVFRAIGDKGNLFANWMVRFETEQVRKPFQIAVRPDHRGVTQALRLETEYFCVPHNTQLEKYWDTVQDRLHKIRNCMNIQGIVRQLPLFEPPLDPGMLVRAAAAGADLGSVVSGLNAPPPQHRFSFSIRRALTLAEELRSFGQAAQRTLEQKDAEALAALRASNENRLQRAIFDVRKVHVKQVEAELSELALEREELELKIQYLTAQTQEFMNPQERASQAAMTLSKVYTIVTEGIELASKIAYAIPEFQSGGAGMSSPFVTLQLGGQMFGSISSAVASTVQKLADRSDVEAELAEAQADYQRRRAEWQQELDVLGKEKARLDKQMAGTNLRLEIANKELRRHELEVESSARVQEFLRTKFTSEQLYGWMLSQLASVHFQVYKFAFDAAQQAQRAFQFERADATASFIEFAYWDSLKRGLFAGERLLLDLRRLEAAYLEGDRRALEITRHLSLREDFPLSYDELLNTGRCEFEVTEALLDGDFPGHYARRIKTVSVSVAAPVKPFSNVNCALTLLSSRVRVDAGSGGNYAAREDAEDARFVNNPVPVQAIATSQVTNDPGLFQLRFDDARYLPFEGAGAVSKWRLALKQTENHLAVSSFEDVVVSVSYAARDGGAPLEAVARASRLRELGQGSMKPQPHLRLSLRRDVPELFQKLAELKSGQELESQLTLSASRLPARYRDFDVRVERVHAVVRPQPRVVIPAEGVKLRLEPPRGAMTPVTGFSMPWPGSKALRASSDTAGPLGDWKVGIGLSGALAGDAIEDVVLQFELKLRA